MTVLEVFGHATLQDAGRPGWRRWGVPVGGAWDRAAARRANALVGNLLDGPVVELALGTMRLRAEQDLAIAVVGGHPHPAGHAFGISSGEELTIGPPRRARLYLAVAGGFSATRTLESVTGMRIEAGSRLAVQTIRAAVRPLIVAESDLPSASGPIRCLAGPQSDLFELNGFFGVQFTASSNADRMGVRLDGPGVGAVQEITSEPACEGATQIANDGRPIVLGPDGPTIGGYPKIAVVIRADLDRLAQVRPGDGMVFEQVTQEAARQAWLSHRQAHDRLIARIRVALGMADGGGGRQ